jgi:hypothetical protein
MNKISTALGLVSATVVLASFYGPLYPKFQTTDNQLTADEKKGGWILLFDGKTTKGWRPYQNKAEDSWVVESGELLSKMQGVTNRADLVTADTYGNFELQLDWKIAPGGNSGVLYHVLETHASSYETGPEVQLIDDFGYPEKLADWQKSGADYAMHPPSKIVSQPTGVYNHLRIVVDGDEVTQWLNGVEVVHFRAWTPEWEKLKSTGKWKDYPDYGLARSGLIALQDHGGGVWFKNIKIRKL